MNCRHLAVSFAVAAAAVLAALLPGTANADENLRIDHLTVVGGESTWHTANEFRLTWDPLPAAALAEVRSVDYLVRDAAGTALDTTFRSGDARTELRQVHIPPAPLLGAAAPGQYTVEVWLEGAAGDGPHASATLRFDDSRPAATRVVSPAGWVRAGAEVVVALEHPATPLPASGIRGYAIALDHGSGAAPCGGPDSCTLTETDLSGGIDDDSLSIGPLAEGTNVIAAVAVAGSGLRSEVTTRTALHVDGSKPSVVLGGVPGGWASHPVQLTATANDPQSGVAAAGPGGPLTSIAVDSGVPTVARGASVSAVVRGDGVHRVDFYARDAVGNSGEARPASATIRIDESPPRVAFARAQDPAEPERIVVTIADPLSGPDLSGGVIAVRPAGSAAQFAPIPTTATGGRLSGLWDSDSFPVGSYEFRATGYDAAGNATSSVRRLDGARMVLANPLKRPTAIQFGFGGRTMVWHRCRHDAQRVRCHREVIASFERRPANRSIPYGRGIPVGGRLLSSSGAPLAGQAVELIESFPAGAAISRRSTTVRTGADGAFLGRLSPGPSREIEVRFAGTRVLTRTVSRTIKLGVQTAVRLRPSSAFATIGGAPVLFSGRIAQHDATVPATGLPVQLQFRVAGSPWSEFRTVQTDSSGRFRYPHSFSDDDSRGVRFQFRAYAPAQPGWPYEPGFSRPIAVTGR